jgi:GNAT superfamily N-acetyltransferase
MSRDELRYEICEGGRFWGFEQDGERDDVTGIQPVKDVTLIRHAYVRTGRQRAGIGAQLLIHLRRPASSPVLIGTWADASWAIRFCEKHGFQLVGLEENNQFLRAYWTVPESQIATSIVLVDRKPHLAEHAID